MNNKKLGSAFEREFCDILADAGWWVHFITPNAAGAQPFDVIAVKDMIPVAIDCKTSEDKTFSISRLEDNQMFAFDKWLAVGNEYAFLAVKHKNTIYMIDYVELRRLEKIRLPEAMRLDEWLKF